MVDVDCSANGTIVSTPVVDAQSDGVHVRARNTSVASGIYLNYSYEPRFGPGGGSGGGDGVGTGVSVRVLKIPPGTAQFQCGADLNRQMDEPVSIEVRDPAHAWRTGALARLDCAPETRAYLESRRGQTQDATAEAALAALAARTDRTSTWRAAQEGYVAAAQQIYVLRRGGISWASAQVDHDPTGGYWARLWMLCQDDWPPPHAATPHSSAR